MCYPLRVLGLEVGSVGDPKIACLLEAAAKWASLSSLGQLRVYSEDQIPPPIYRLLESTVNYRVKR